MLVITLDSSIRSSGVGTPPAIPATAGGPRILGAPLLQAS